MSDWFWLWAAIARAVNDPTPRRLTDAELAFAWIDARARAKALDAAKG